MDNEELRSLSIAIEVFGDDMEKTMPIGAILQWQELQNTVNKYVKEQDPDKAFLLMRQFSKIRNQIRKELDEEKTRD